LEKKIMSKKSKKVRGGGMVFSTDKETMQGLFEGITVANDEIVIKPVTKKKEKKAYNDQVRVWLDRKRKGGKEVTVVQGIGRPDSQLKDLASTLKTKCGVGGSAKNQEILIQGNQRDKVIQLLKEMGFHNTKSAGG
jgi:predicted translation initiation factor SUI1